MLSQNLALSGTGAVLAALAMSGCIKKQAAEQRPMFEQRSMDACLAIAIDLSGSFSQEFGEGAYPLVLALVDRFAAENLGADCKIVLSQMSGHDQVVLFEGTPEALRTRFQSPEQLKAFLLENSEAGQSPVYEATGKTIAYVNRMNGIGPQTRVMVAMLSDLQDSEVDKAKRSAEGHRMLASLKTYRERGGGLALYFVNEDEVVRWQKILEMAGFEAGSYLISNRLVATPELPRFD